MLDNYPFRRSGFAIMALIRVCSDLESTLMNLEKTLERIGYSGSLDVNADVLSALQKAFLYSVPFENLDIHAGIPITLDPERFYQKIVIERRGGFCYECNTLFYQMLLQLGFDVQMIAARMVLTDINSQRYSHMALLVYLEQPYLADVGNGQSIHAAMPVPGEEISVAEDIAYRVGPLTDQEYALYYKKPGAEWLPRFAFPLATRQLADFEPMCRFHQTAPESLFMKQRICTLPTPGGRISLLGNELAILDHGREQTRELNSDAQISLQLQKHFGFTLPVSKKS